MIEIKKIYKIDIPELLNNEAFWKHSFISISKHRLYAHYKNPNCNDDDIVLLLSYLNKELVGYMGVFMDIIILNNIKHKIGWLSTWWVHPKTKGSGIGREILNTMYLQMNGKIGISQFTESAKRVYDKSGYFVSLNENIGLKAVLRSNTSFVLPSLFPILTSSKSIFNLLDVFLNLFVNFKLAFQRLAISNRLNSIQLEYLNVIDKETTTLITKFGINDISPKTPLFFEWLKAYDWVQKAPLIELTNKHKYAFSMFDKHFDIFYIKVLEDNICIAFIVLQKRNYVCKVLFSYFDKSKHSAIVADIIKLQCIEQNVREIICYDESINVNFKASNIFLYKTKKVKQSIISKSFNINDFSEVRMNFGDGDCCFA